MMRTFLFIVYDIVSYIERKINYFIFIYLFILLLQTFGGVSGIDERFSRLTTIKGHQGPPAGKYLSKTKPNIIPN
jgi:hypothetical protein